MKTYRTVDLQGHEVGHSLLKSYRSQGYCALHLQDTETGIVHIHSGANFP
uniref:Uncharacterized protein n=1 Tax=Anguilla anguilla TaxID=7936 RepID=A0A0E9SL25_ANGAN